MDTKFIFFKGFLPGSIIQDLHFPEVDHGGAGLEYPEPDMSRIQIIRFMEGGVDGDPSRLSHKDLVPAMMTETPAVFRRVNTTPDDPGRNTSGTAEGSQQHGLCPTCPVPPLQGLQGRSAVNGASNAVSHP